MHPGVGVWSASRVRGHEDAPALPVRPHSPAAAGVAALTFSLAPNAYLLIPGRVLTGLATILTFTIGAALLGDLTRGPERGYAFGLYATAMGLGFAVGPLVGGLLRESYGIATVALATAA